MDDLDWVFELGPSLNYYLIGEPNSRQHLYLSLFARKAIATDFSGIDDIGWRYGPSVYYRVPIIEKADSQFSLAFRGNINFASDKYLDYYYGVTYIAMKLAKHTQVVQVFLALMYQLGYILTHQSIG